MSFSTRRSLHHKIACLGLFAILLITLGPVISQVQAMLLLHNSSASHNMSHHQAMAQQSTTEVSHLPADKQKIQSTSTSHHFMSLCGYCDLVHHCPLITIYTPIIITEPQTQETVHPLYLVDYRSPSYCKALSRAPPFKII